jgi:hypothetical protein
VVDMGASNSWAEFAGLFLSTRPAFLDHERAKTELKGLMPEEYVASIISPGDFEPVSVKTQPVSGCSRSQISDIENSSSRDSLRNSRPLVGEALDFLPETRLLPAKPPEMSPVRRAGIEDSNCDMSNSKPRRAGRPEQPRANLSSARASIASLRAATVSQTGLTATGRRVALAHS